LYLSLKYEFGNFGGGAIVRLPLCGCGPSVGGLKQGCDASISENHQFSKYPTE